MSTRSITTLATIRSGDRSYPASGLGQSYGGGGGGGGVGPQGQQGPTLIMDDFVDVDALVDSLNSQSESARKLAAFQLQTLVEDPEFVDIFVKADGMPALNDMVLQEVGNTLAYALGSLARILELDYGWDQVGEQVVERAVDLVVAQPNINVLRNAFKFLVLLVSRPSNELEYPAKSPGGTRLGPDLETLKPILKERTNFLDSLIDKLSSADHALCANALKFMNALIRDSILTFSETQLMRFVKRLQDLEIFSTVEGLMRGEILEEDIATQVLDFQTLTKVMLRCWRFVPVDMSRQAHREALEGIRKTAKKALGSTSVSTSDTGPEGGRSSRSRDKRPATAATSRESANQTPDLPSWVSVGFETEDPAQDLHDTGLLGLMDLADFVRKNSDFFERTLLEQSVVPAEQRCPVAKACLAVTRVLYDHFAIGASSASPRASSANLLGQLRRGPYQDANGEKAEDMDDEAYIAAAAAKITPLLLARDKLHGALTHAFFRLWTASEASTVDFGKIELLIRLLVSRTVGGVTRHAMTQDVEDSIHAVNLPLLRKWQLDELDKQQRNAWGQDFGRLRDRLNEEAVQFMQEQRIRCLLEGAWFPWLPDTSSPIMGNMDPDDQILVAWCFVRLDRRRRYLHHAQFARRQERSPALTELPQRIDVQRISSVVSNVEAGVVLPDEVRQWNKASGADQQGGGNKRKPGNSAAAASEATVTRLTIRGGESRGGSGGGVGAGLRNSEMPLLELQTADTQTASEWLDGLLMLLDQEPITADTNRLIEIIGSWSLKVRTLDLDEDVDWDVAADSTANGGLKAAHQGGEGELAADEEFSREGLDDDYWYDMGEN